MRLEPLASVRDGSWEVEDADVRLESPASVQDDSWEGEDVGGETGAAVRDNCLLPGTVRSASGRLR